MVSIVLSLLPTILSLVLRLVVWGRERGLIEQGKLLEIAEASQRLNKSLALAAAAEQEAADSAAKDPTDGAFDQTFKRPD